MAPKKGENEKGGGRFPKDAFKVLQDIIIHAEGGRFLEPVVTRDVSRNFEKKEVWLDITAIFNEVKLENFVIVFLSFAVLLIRNNYFLIRILPERSVGDPNQKGFKRFEGSEFDQTVRIRIRSPTLCRKACFKG